MQLYYYYFLKLILNHKTYFFVKKLRVNQACNFVLNISRLSLFMKEKQFALDELHSAAAFGSISNLHFNEIVPMN